MYNVSCQNHDVYGNIVKVSIEENGVYYSPFEAANYARLTRRLWAESGAIIVRFLINDQIMSIKEMEKWSIEEYNFLPKCYNCKSILKINVFTHQFCKTNLFCSQKCADDDYNLEINKINDEEDCEI